MKKIAEWFFSFFVDKSKIEKLKKEASNELRSEILEYKNKVYFNKLRNKCR